MAELHTVKPDGGGDYTLLQTAEDAQDGDLTGRGVVTLECYDGTADLGTCQIQGWTNVDASNHVRIFVPLAERHNGTTATGGAHIACDTASSGIFNNTAYTRLEGIRFDNSSTGDSVNSGTNGAVVDSCLSVHTAGSNNGFYLASTVTVTATLRNNILYGYSAAAGSGIKVPVTYYIASTVTAILQNNTVNGFLAGIELDEVSPNTLNVTLENNICTNNGIDFDASGYGGGAGTITGNNNCSEDATADDWDGSGSIVSQTPADLFVTEGSDHHLKEGSNAINVGKTIAEFDGDALHLDGYSWRPKGTTWDMGALEYTPADKTTSPHG